MSASIPVRLAALNRDIHAFQQRVERVAHEVPPHPARTPEVLAAVRPLFAAADAFADRAESIARQMKRPAFFDKPLSSADRGVAMILDAAHNATRTVTQVTGVGEHDHSPLTIDRKRVGSVAAAARWAQLVGAHDLPNVRLIGGVPAPAGNFVHDRLENVPAAAVEITDKLGTRGSLFTGKLTDVYGYMSLRGQHPRGWPKGSTWDTVPGAGGDRGFAANPSREQTGRGHGSTSLALHEYGHVVDRSIATPTWRAASASASFKRGPWREARQRESLKPYLRDHSEEWFAESFARYSKSPQDAAALARWYPQTYAWLEQHLGDQQFSR